jgi:hypothetical protein
MFERLLSLRGDSPSTTALSPHVQDLTLTPSRAPAPAYGQAITA